MSRQYTQFSNNRTIELLDRLAQEETSPQQYQEVMFELGVQLGYSLLNSIDNRNGLVYLACTVEDADFLAKGILSVLEKEVPHIAFACFWNQRFSPFDIEDLKVAPILKQYQEPVENKDVPYLIVVKSIISGACVVRTNLTNLIQKINPQKILIAAPVIYQTAEEKLNKEFPPEIHNKFEYYYFAKDDERTPQGIIIPGIGGSVYERLGFAGQEDKNKYVPQLVKERRRKMLQLI
jgi:hypothetical protein